MSRLLLTGALAALTVLLAATPVRAQEPVPLEYEAREAFIARGILDGNLIETNFRNHGEWARFGDVPHGVWPRGVGGRHIDGISAIISGEVYGERVKWGLAQTDTTLNPAIIHYRGAGRKRGENDDLIYGWLPLRGFLNPDRIDPITSTRRPVPALSDDPTSWPAFWPDRLTNPDDPGWRNDDVDNDPDVAGWNGIFGKGVFNADLEAYYVMNDHTDYEYRINPVTGRPTNTDGVFYPSPSDSTMGGLGLQVAVRSLQWANVLAEDAMFILYTVSNVGETDHDRLYFSQLIDYGLPPETNELAAFNPQLDIAYGWDGTGLCTRTDGGGTYDCGYTGVAFLESPALPVDGLDNDEDGIVDESRFSGPGVLLTGQAAIRDYVVGNYDVARFVAFNGTPGQTTLDQVLADRPAFAAERWWTGDENLDWVGYGDENGNGAYDDGEPINDDYGLDGLGPFDLGYPGPDTGEADGTPNVGEPNFDRTDIDESDQIGLTGFDLNSRPFYEAGDNLRTDAFIFERVLESQFELGTPPAEQVANIEPMLFFSSGPTGLRPYRTDPSLGIDFFSTAWLFGSDEEDFFKNRRTVQAIYDSDYLFAQPPIAPTLSAQAGDGRVTLTWDDVSLLSFDRFCRTFDFEGYKLYRGTDPILSDARTITDANGTPTFYEPIAQFDLVNGVVGTTTALGGDIRYDLGDDEGLRFFYVDDDVKNGFTYYYALVAYDSGCRLFEFDDDGFVTGGPFESGGSVEPQENTFNVSVDALFNLRGLSRNAAVVTPRSNAAGYDEAGINEDLTAPTGGTRDGNRPLGTGSAEVRVFDSDAGRADGIYRIEFDGTDTGDGDEYRTLTYTLTEVTRGDTLLRAEPFAGSTPAVDGFVVVFSNDESFSFDFDRTGWVGEGPEGGTAYNLNPGRIQNAGTTWNLNVEELTTLQDEDAAFAYYDYELRWVDPADSLYRPPRYRLDRYLRAEIPVFARNVATGEPVDLVIRDFDEDGAFGVNDALFVVERVSSGFAVRHRLTFEGDPGGAPAPGTRIRISRVRPFATGDYFQFTLRPARVDDARAAAELDDILVVPNPYVGAALWEQASPQAGGRGEREIQFRNLPQRCTIRIFNVRGELIRTLEHDALGGDGQLSWDVKTSENLDPAYGVYVYHVEAPGLGEFVGKFAIVK